MILQPTIIVSRELFDLFGGRRIKKRLEKLVIRGVLRYAKGVCFAPHLIRLGVKEEGGEDTFQAKRRWRKLKGSSFTIWMIIQVFLHS